MATPTITLTVQLPPELWEVLDRMPYGKTEAVRAWLRSVARAEQKAEAKP